MLTTLQDDPMLDRPDSRAWAGRLGLHAPVAPMDAAQALALLPRMIDAGDILPQDLLCHFLGDGTAASALDLIARADIELIDATRLDTWRMRQWQAPPRPWANMSRGFVTWDALPGRLRKRLAAMIRQDLILYRCVAPRLAGHVSIPGLSLAGLAPPRAILARPPGRAARPLLRTPRFPRPDGALGPMDPPLNYRTIETTLRLPFVDTRIRVRYVRRGHPAALLRRIVGVLTRLGARRQAV